MSLLRIAWRSIGYRRLASLLTAFSMSLGVALVVMVIVVSGIISASFRRGSQGYDLIVGPKGSSLEIVLSTTFYMRDPVGTVPEKYLKELRSGRFSNAVELAIPVAIGHHFRQCPIVGTRPEFFEKLRYMDDRPYAFAQGRNIDPFEDFSAVVGWRAAKKAGLRLGDTFEPTPEEGRLCGAMHQPFKVVGILAPTGTPNDNAIFVHLDGFFDMHSHDHDAEETHAAPTHDAADCDDPDCDHDHAHDHDAATCDDPNCTHDHSGGEGERTFSAILVLTKRRSTDASFVTNPGTDSSQGTPGGEDAAVAAARLTERQTLDFSAMQLPIEIDKMPDIQAVFPYAEISDLLENLIGKVQIFLTIIGVLVIVVAGIGMMVSIYNSMNERRHEIAVMRALGAQRMTVMGIILLESILLSLCGGGFGFLLGHALTEILSPLISSYTGIIIRFWDVQWMEIALIPGLVILASLVGYLPAVIAYRTDVGSALAD